MDKISEVMNRQVDPAAPSGPVVSGSTATAPAVVLTDVQRAAALSAYKGLIPDAILAKPIKALPNGAAFASINPEQGRFRSASFGRSVTLLVSDNAKQFYVQYGRSTNSPAGIYGPFALS